MRNLTIILLFLIILIKSVNGQHTDDTLSGAGNLYLNIRNINFIKNNEYSNPVTEGATLIGYFLQPEIVYLPSHKLTLRLGIHLLSYSGTNKFSLIKPVFSTSYYFSEHSSVTIGSLSGSDKHNMFDPHYNRERMYNAYSEDGLQFITSNDHVFSDTWLNWENFIFKGDSTREIFTAGESFRYSSSLIGDLFRVQIPVQLQFKHYGGQISNYPEHIETYFNIATGARISIEIADKKYGEAGGEYLMFIGKELTGNSPTGISYGNGEWYKLFYSYKMARLEIGYWQAHDFFAPNGNYIYGYVSDYRKNVILHDRRILTGSANLTLIPDRFVELYLGFEGFYDLNLKRFDHSITLHLSFDKLIKIASVEK